MCFIFYLFTTGWARFKIFFFNSKKEIVYSTGKVNPGKELITSKIPTKYVVEVP